MLVSISQGRDMGKGEHFCLNQVVLAMPGLTCPVLYVARNARRTGGSHEMPFRNLRRIVIFSPSSRVPLAVLLFCFVFCFFFATIDCSLVNSIIPTRFSKEHNLVLPPHKKM